MSDASNPARAERAALCQLFDEVGPDAPTLCGSWTTRDLAAHLVMRERRPDGAIGIVVPGVSGYADKVQAKIAATEWSDLVDLVRSGPPVWSPMRLAVVDKLANTAEFYVHHEDVRRGAPGWQPRRLDDHLTNALYELLGRFGKRLVRACPVGIVVEPTEDLPPLVLHDREPSVALRGAVGELVLFVFGRQANARVTAVGDDASVADVMDASFGI